MRLKRNRIVTVYHKSAIARKDGEGNSYVEYGRPSPIKAEQWPAGGKLQAQMYGLRLPNIRNLRLEGSYAEVRRDSGQITYKIEKGPVIAANDGICLFVARDKSPDYRIVAIYPYAHLALEVERI